MHHQALLRRSRYLLNFYLRTRPPRPIRRPLSTTTTTPTDPPDAIPEKPRLRRPRLSLSIKESEPIQLPNALDVLWTPESVEHQTPESSHLPPTENFQDALNNLLISLHPQTQHRAAYATPLGAPTEPSLAFYCPIEGGDYIIDATVKELARRIGAEVLVLDAVQLAAGEWGHFGPAANSLSLPRNPLHFSTTVSSPFPSQLSSLSRDDELDVPLQMLQSPRMMTLATIPPHALQARTILTSPSRRNQPLSKIKVFFDTLVNMQSDSQASAMSTSGGSRPRLIYVRDFPTLAPSSSSWYPPLLSAVRERRRGPISRPSFPVCNPTTIIFGMTPSLVPPLPRSGHTEPKSGRSDWGEDEVAETAREKRLRDRLQKWDNAEAMLLEELPKLSTTQEGDGDGDSSDVIVIAPPGFPFIPGPRVSGSATGQPGSQNDTSFFRTSILVPKLRSITEERAVRVARRREINELTMRMGVGAAGGVLDQATALSIHLNSVTEADTQSNTTGVNSPDNSVSMWEDWGYRVEVWSNVRRIADRAIGETLTTERALDSVREKATLDSTVVPWFSVHKAWSIHRSSKELRTSWLKETFSVQTIRKQDEADQDGREQIDEVVESIKNDGELDPHEEKLLPCIVDAASMPTSFNQVHLPPHTIDSVRTIVSLPLLHPQAFQHGILKDHAMTGCLLFGPPGTGKTLVVRALAKEAGCRMLAISPSDVMDMYVGEGEKLVKAVFSLARKLSPCVVFLDEIDALFGARMSTRESGGAFAHRGVITEFMQEMDGLKSSKEDRVIVIGATNRPFDLDDAVLRRLPRRLLVDLPGEPERVEILKILLRNERLANDVNIQALAKRTESFSGSDLKHLCVSAALDAVKENVHLPWGTWTSTSLESFQPLSSTGVMSLSETSLESLPSTPSSTATLDHAGSGTLNSSTSESNTRILHLHNFAKALKEITPSSSESLGTVAELRKWNDEFGEGRRDRKHRQFWGKGRFGFTGKRGQDGDNAKVIPSLEQRPDSFMPDS